MGKELESELLQRLVDDNRILKRYALIRTCLFGLLVLVILGTAAAYYAKLKPAIETVTNAAASVEEAAASIEGVTSSLDELRQSAQTSLESAQALSSSASQMIEDNTKNVSEALENFNSIDFEKLNQAIQDLSDVVKPLAQFFSAF